VKLHVNQLESYINSSKEVLDAKDIEEVEHFFKHDEFEMAYEGLLIELTKAEVYPMEFNFQKWKDLGEHYSLDKVRIFDEAIWEKFLKWGISHGGVMKEYSVVKAKNTLSNNVEAGTMGTIVFVFSSQDFEIEFVNENGLTLDILTVSLNDIDLYEPY